MGVSGYGVVPEANKSAFSSDSDAYPYIIIKVTRLNFKHISSIHMQIGNSNILG
jgi:hypothetical protein